MIKNYPIVLPGIWIKQPMRARSPYTEIQTRKYITQISHTNIMGVLGDVLLYL